MKKPYINFYNEYSFKLEEEELRRKNDLFITIRPAAFGDKYLHSRTYDILLDRKFMFTAKIVGIKRISVEDITLGIAWADSRVTAAKLIKSLKRIFLKTLGIDYDDYLLITLRRIHENKV